MTLLVSNAPHVMLKSPPMLDMRVAPLHGLSVVVQPFLGKENT